MNLKEKEYIMTEKQLRQLKKLLEVYEFPPLVIEGGIGETNRELKYLIEDIEAQEMPMSASCISGLMLSSKRSILS